MFATNSLFASVGYLLFFWVSSYSISPTIFVETIWKILIIIFQYFAFNPIYCVRNIAGNKISIDDILVHSTSQCWIHFVCKLKQKHHVECSTTSVACVMQVSRPGDQVGLRVFYPPDTTPVQRCVPMLNYGFQTSKPGNDAHYFPSSCFDNMIFMLLYYHDRYLLWTT